MPLITKIVPFIFLLLFPLSVSAAQTSLSLPATKRYIYLTFSDLKNVSRVSYTLTYSSRNQQKGFEGGFKINPKTNRTTRRQILGTCSTRFCSYHPAPSNFLLTTVFYFRSGGSTSTTTRL